MNLAFVPALLAFSLSAQAAPPTIQGVWQLDRWLVRNGTGVERPFCDGANGFLAYDASGFVSTSINCPGRARQLEPADWFGRVFFYAGTYFQRNDVIYKDVANATFLPLIGKRVLRKIEKLSHDELVLTGSFGGAGDSLWIRWVRRHPDAPRSRGLPPSP